MVDGGSYGGHMTLAVAYLYSDRIRCSVDVVGSSNLVTFLENTRATAATCAASSTATSATRRCARSWSGSLR